MPETKVSAAIRKFHAASEDLQHCTRVEMLGEAGKPVQRRDALLRIVGTDNPLTGKPHSASSAETVANEEPVFSLYLRACTDAVISRMKAETAVQAARWNVELAIAEHSRMRETVGV
jgi:CelD/BcsL family acetyltransferase involved in cellulose biosynthesis